MTKRLAVISLTIVLLARCAAEKGDNAVVETATVTPTVTATESEVASTESNSPAEPPLSENAEMGTWEGQVKVSDPVSTLNYVGSESGDWVPMRFRNDSEAG